MAAQPPSSGAEAAAAAAGQQAAPVALSSSEALAKLKDLRELLDAGFITVAEYDERREQLINALTGTQRKRARLRTEKEEVPKVVPRPPPTNFDHAKRERAKLHSFDPDSGRWSSREITLRIDDVPFARGALRLCYYASLDNDPDSVGTPRSSSPPRPPSPPQPQSHPLAPRTSHPGPQIFVAKLSVDPFEEKSQYFTDVQVQMYSRMFAVRFNAYSPPKKIEFLKAWLVELVERRNSPMCGVERFIHGQYRKHNNNFGFVSDLERSTPQAFSHFTYEASGHKMLVCDIQGIDDVYTDPQIHSADDFELSRFLQGKGNLGQRGLETFLSAHRCNSICRYLRLPPVGHSQDPEDGDWGAQAGSTMPSERFMRQQRVDVVPVVSPTSPLINRSGRISQVGLPPPRDSSICPCCTIL